MTIERSRCWSFILESRRSKSQQKLSSLLALLSFDLGTYRGMHVKKYFLLLTLVLLLNIP